jgi:RNA polymerase sigma-70 factor (ECF subfamily)
MPEPAPTSAATNPELWLEEHGDALYAYAMGRVRDSNVAEELVQETLVTAIERRESFEGRSSVRTWLIGILRHCLLRYYRKSAREGPSLDSELPADLVDEQFGRSGKWKKGPKRWGLEPENIPESEEFRNAVVECLEKLPGRVAEAFLLNERQEAPADTLGKILGATATNVYVMLYRARVALRQCLERTWFGASRGKDE